MKITIFFLSFIVSQQVLASSLFEETTSLNIVLRGNISSNIKNRIKDQRSYKEVTISLEGQEYEALMKVRGNARGKQCDIPPLKIKILEKNKYLKKKKAYKIVTHCNDREISETGNSVGAEVPIAGDNYLLKEYLSYKIQNLVMRNGYRVRLLRITYIDDDKKIPYLVRYGFILERSKDLAKRLKATYLDDVKFVDVDKLLLKELIWSSYFNLLIGNQDYLLWGRSSHNFKFFEADTGVVTVPYDFNLSELMNNKKNRNPLNYNMYTHMSLFPCNENNEKSFRDIGKHLFSKREKILEYLDQEREVPKALLLDIRSFLDTQFEQLEKIVLNESSSFKTTKVSWSPGFCKISFD